VQHVHVTTCGHKEHLDESGDKKKKVSIKEPRKVLRKEKSKKQYGVKPMMIMTSPFSTAAPITFCNPEYHRQYESVPMMALQANDTLAL
jgi:hypothetical protein